MLQDKMWLEFKMLILTEIQYLQSQKYESLNCFDFEVQEQWSHLILVSDFVQTEFPLGGVSNVALFYIYLYIQCHFILHGPVIQSYIKVKIKYHIVSGDRGRAVPYLQMFVYSMLSLLRNKGLLIFSPIFPLLFYSYCSASLNVFLVNVI